MSVWNAKLERVFVDQEPLAGGFTLRLNVDTLLEGVYDVVVAGSAQRQSV